MKRLRWTPRSHCSSTDQLAGDGHEHTGVAGSLLVELMVALAILSIGLLSFLYTSQSVFQARREVNSRDLVSTALVNAVEFLENEEFTTLYATYHNRLLPAPTSLWTDNGSAVVGELERADGTPAQVRVFFDINETTLPPEYGPIRDLDGDGALSTADVSSDYELLPARLSITYATSSGSETRNMFVVFQ